MANPGFAKGVRVRIGGSSWSPGVPPRDQQICPKSYVVTPTQNPDPFTKANKLKPLNH